MRGATTTRRPRSPTQRLVEENARRGLDDLEFELLDTGVFDDGATGSVDVTYAKASPTDVLMQVTPSRTTGPTRRPLHVLPTLWFRNTWRWRPGGDVPALSARRAMPWWSTIRGLPATGSRPRPARTGRPPTPLFCDNETNVPRLFGGEALTAYPKDGINDHVVAGAATVNPGQRGTKAAWWYRLTVPGRWHRRSCGCACTGPS